MFGLDSYHLLLVALGLVIILANWLPRFVTGREPAASALLIGLGALAFAFPGEPHMPDPVASPQLWEVFSELTVIVGLFGVGISIDRIGQWRRWRGTVRLLLLAMPLTILAVAWLGAALAGLGLASALLLGAVLAPTDPVLAGDVQVGKPQEGGEHPVRFMLTTEAGLNDGLAFPFVYLALAVATGGVLSWGELGDWLWRDLGWRIAVGGVTGAAVGWLLGRVLFLWPAENALSRTEAGVVAFAGVLVSYGAAELAEGYGFIAVFVTGLTVRRAEAGHEFHLRLHAFAESIEHALTAVLLVALGASLPALWPFIGWPEVAVAALLVFVVRPLVGWASLAGVLRGRERLVVAFYGVRGVGSVYYLSFAGHKQVITSMPSLWAIVTATILISTLVHGFTAGLAVEQVAPDGETPPP